MKLTLQLMIITFCLAMPLTPLRGQAVPTEQTTLILAQDDTIAILQQIFDFLRLVPTAEFPTLAAHEPGPLELQEGLRLLPNEVSPRFGVPQLLLLSQAAAAQADVSLLALIRRVLLQGGQVWVVGNRLPDTLVDLPLEPGQEIQRIDVATLAAALYTHTVNRSSAQ